MILSAHNLIKRANLASVDNQHGTDGMPLLALLSVPFGLAMVNEECLYATQLLKGGVMALNRANHSKIYCPFLKFLFTKSTRPLLKMLNRME